MKKNILVLFVLSGFIFSCKDDVELENENELITTIKLQFVNGSETKTFQFKDPDGDGGQSPVIDNITLKANTGYQVSVSFLDESKTPAEDLTTEVSEESDEHLVIFTSNPSSLGVYTYSDKDVNGFPVGLKGNYKTGNAGSGSLKVQLRHQPPVNNKAVKDGSVSPGSDDANVDFKININ
ncbi:MAG: hypothetical protein LCH67_02715 [Bacteroidetes bacterium]|nr:hypothetical protein [Bacteroidota bacterium]